jgi:hypothetical protein
VRHCRAVGLRGHTHANAVTDANGGRDVDLDTNPVTNANRRHKYADSLSNARDGDAYRDAKHHADAYSNAACNAAR